MAENPIRFKSLLSWSSDVQIVPPALAPATFTWTISEQGISGQYAANDDLVGVFTNLRHRNVNLSTGFVHCPTSSTQDRISCILSRHFDCKITLTTMPVNSQLFRSHCLSSKQLLPPMLANFNIRFVDHTLLCYPDSASNQTC